MTALGIIDAAENWDSGLAQYVFDDRVAQARSVVVEMKAVGFFVVAKFVEAVGI